MEDDYRALQRTVDREFQRGVRVHGSRINCAKGCSQCCSTLFQITELEAAYVSRGVRELTDHAHRDRLIARAQEYMRQRNALVAKDGNPESWGRPAQGHIPCPALEDGACSIYSFRPLLCRYYGVPLHSPDKPGGVMVCELNFKDGEGFRDPDLIQIQTGIHRRWERLQNEYNDQGGYRDPQPMCIGRAIAEDLSAHAL